MAEGLARALFDERGVDITVSSCGISTDGSSAAGLAIELLERRGIDLSTHVSTALTADRISAADLIVALSRRHAREVVMLDPTALARTFTLRELVRRGVEAGPCPEGIDVRAWAEAVSGDRPPAAFLGASSHDDIPDPYGQGASAYESVIAELDEHLAALADLFEPSFQEASP